MFSFELYIFIKVLIYFCIGILFSCAFLYFTIPVLKEENYSFLFSIVFFWPILIPIYLIIYLSRYALEGVEEWRRKRIDRNTNR